MILLWGLAADGPLAAVRSALRRLGADHAFVDQEAMDDTDIQAPDGMVGGGGRIRQGDLTIDLDDVTAVYLRPDEWGRVGTIAKTGFRGALARRALEFEDALLGWTELTSALVVNRPSAMSSNHSKPYQLGLIRTVGLDTPETLVTTDPDAVIEFQRRHRTLIYKSVSGVRSIVATLGAGQLARLDDITACPTQFQEQVEGTDYRVHVVGEEVFASRILCEAVDYRYAARSGKPVEISACTPPAEIAQKCRALAFGLGLHLAGVDLRRTPAGRWVCFEANPSPAFTFYEAHTGQPMAEAVARLLMRDDQSRAGCPEPRLAR